MRNDSQIRHQIEGLLAKPELFMPGFLHQADSTRFDEAAPFIGWKVQTITFLIELLGADHPYVLQFTAHVQHPTVGDAKAGQSILRAIQEDLDNDYLAVRRPSS